MVFNKRILEAYCTCMGKIGTHVMAGDEYSQEPGRRLRLFFQNYQIYKTRIYNEKNENSSVCVVLCFSES